MNPAPFETAEIRLLRRNLIDAKKLSDAATAFLTTRAGRQREVEPLTTRFVATIDIQVAQELAALHGALRNLEPGAAAIEAVGGPEGVRRQALRTMQNHVYLEKAFRDREDAINKLITPARKALGARRAELSEAGLQLGAIETDGAVQRLRASIYGLESAARDAGAMASYCRGWGETRNEHSVTSLVDRVSAPLPTV